LNHGYETPKQALETGSKARCGVLNHPLRFRNWSFNNKGVVFLMRKISYCLLIIAAALIVISCSGKGDSERASINPGLYEINHDIKYSGQLIILKQRVRYKTDGTFEATNFQNNAAVEELKGNYKIENKQLVFNNTQYRLITQEGTWEQKDIVNVDIRKIKNESYQYYFKFPDDQTREQLKGIGLAEGWKTYKRVSD
jgi:hypothetical protein